MPVRTRGQARRPRRSALIVGSDYRGLLQPRSTYLVNDAYLIQRYLIEQRIYAEQDVTVLTDELPSGVFYDSGLRTTRVTEDMIVNHLLTLVREEFSTPGDTVFFFYSCHSALRAPGEEPSVILGLGRNV
jgi:hypothetical protein